MASKMKRLTLRFKPPLKVPAIPDEDLELSLEAFNAKYINPAMKELVDRGK